MNKGLFIASILVLFGIASRFLFLIDGISWLPNFSAVGAVAIFGTCHLKGVYRWVTPLLLLWISDLVLNNVIYAEYYSSMQFIGSPWVYGSFLLTGLMAYWFLKRATWLRLAYTAVGSGVVFYLITNFGSWLTLDMYTKDLAGLGAAYLNAVPFFFNTVAGNLFYGFLLFGVYEWIARSNVAIDSMMSTSLEHNPA
ncbi:MAG: DUF6580 family putative transport protein [Bacteroidota bacterium]